MYVHGLFISGGSCYYHAHMRTKKWVHTGGRVSILKEVIVMIALANIQYVTTIHGG